MRTTTLRLTSDQVARLLDAMEGVDGPLSMRPPGITIHKNGSPHDTRDEEAHDALIQRLSRAYERLTD